MRIPSRTTTCNDGCCCCEEDEGGRRRKKKQRKKRANLNARLRAESGSCCTCTWIRESHRKITRASLEPLIHSFLSALLFSATDRSKLNRATHALACREGGLARGLSLANHGAELVEPNEYTTRDRV